MRIVLLGPPGVGKGTQGRCLAQESGIPLISTGEMLRDAAARGTPFGLEARRQVDAGLLVADDVMIGLVKERTSELDAAKGYVLDGFPRTVPQAVALDDMMRGRGPLVVVDIVVPEDVLMRRLAARRICGSCGINASIEWTTACGSCGGQLVTRTDDEDGVVHERLKVYHRQTKPIVEFYAGRPTFRHIDGNQPPDVVTAALSAAIREASLVPAPVKITPGAAL